MSDPVCMTPPNNLDTCTVQNNEYTNYILVHACFGNYNLTMYQANSFFLKYLLKCHSRYFLLETCKKLFHSCPAILSHSKLFIEYSDVLHQLSSLSMKFTPSLFPTCYVRHSSGTHVNSACRLHFSLSLLCL